MAQRALVRVDGFITDIVESGEEFEIYTGPGASMKWMDIPDDATNLWKLELGEWIPDFEAHDPEMLRVVAYGDPGQQLAMIYNDIKNGTLTEEGEFFKHVKNVKDTLPPVQYDENGNSVNPDEPFPHDESMPAWFSPEQMPDDVQQEFKIGKYAPE
jgi:hypothetical protein|tara:strand:+ start:1996 stop:2463 length:468 start_codon:yes stop_codon:yes gene_type:complete